MARRYRPPHWTTARYPGRCRRCGADIPRGAPMFWYPHERAAYCERDECGQQEERDIEAARFDEAVYNG